MANKTLLTPFLVLGPGACSQQPLRATINFHRSVSAVECILPLLLSVIDILEMLHTPLIRFSFQLDSGQGTSLSHPSSDPPDNCKDVRHASLNIASLETIPFRIKLECVPPLYHHHNQNHRRQPLFFFGASFDTERVSCTLLAIVGDANDCLRSM